MRYDLLIRGGEVIDPANDVSGHLDIAVSDGRIAAVATNLPIEDARHIVDATGQYVTPGLVDLHTHIYWGATYWGVEPDPIAARSGVTTWVDAGSAGAHNFPGFRRYVVESYRTRILGFLNISVIGLTTRTFELANLDYCDPAIGQRIVEANRDVLVGIKARVDRDTTRGTGIAGLHRARDLADRVSLPLMVHIAVGPPLLDEILPLLRAGDILTHCCTGQSNRITEPNGTLRPDVHALWQRGLILDVGHGTGSFSFEVAERMIADGYLPDVISSDIHQLSVHGPMFDLPTTLSKFLHLGMSLQQVIERATVRPARAINRPELGALAVGSPADIAVFRLDEGRFVFHDIFMVERVGQQRLVNSVTIVGGTILEQSPERPPHLWVEDDLPPGHKQLGWNTEQS